MAGTDLPATVTPATGFARIVDPYRGADVGGSVESILRVARQSDKEGASEETSVAGERLWFVSDSVADTTGNRKRAYDPKGPSEVVGKRGCGRPGSFHCLVVRPRGLTGFAY